LRAIWTKFVRQDLLLIDKFSLKDG